MNTHTENYTKERFLKFLEKNSVNDIIISRFVKLPKTVQRSGSIFKLDINTTWYPDGDTHYNFELNYYSEELVEYRFSSKVFGDVEESINYLLCELMINKLIEGSC